MVAKVLNLQPFGPTGVVNGNQLSSVGQGLKKLFKPQPEYPRIFTLGDEGVGTGKQKRGSNSGVLPTVGFIETCCMYLMQGLLSPPIEPYDLPDALTINGISYSRSGRTYGDTTNGITYNGNNWTKYLNGISSEQDCLISSGIQDQFADQYILNTLVYLSGTSEDYTISEDGIDVLLTRVSLCRWESEDKSYALEFVSFSPIAIWQVIGIGFGSDEYKVSDVNIGDITVQQYQNNPLGLFYEDPTAIRYIKPA